MTKKQNKRRFELIYKKYEHGGLTQEEEEELEKLQEICGKHQRRVAPIPDPPFEKTIISILCGLADITWDDDPDPDTGICRPMKWRLLDPCIEITRCPDDTWILVKDLARPIPLCPNMFKMIEKLAELHPAFAKEIAEPWE